MKPETKNRSNESHFHSITTRRADNDAYRHVNNVVYFNRFDTVINQFLTADGVLDSNYFSPVAFPDQVTAGLRVTRLGNASVRYKIGIFRNGDEQAAARGHLVHVYVDRDGRRPAGVPEPVRQLLQTVQMDAAETTQAGAAS